MVHNVLGEGRGIIELGPEHNLSQKTLHTGFGQLVEHRLPVDAHVGEDNRTTFAGHFDDFRVVVMPVLQAVQRNDAVDRVNQPIFPDAGAFVEGALGQVVVAGRGGRQDFDDPVRGAADVAFGDLVGVADDQDVRLHHRRRVGIVFTRCRQ